MGYGIMESIGEVQLLDDRLFRLKDVGEGLRGIPTVRWFKVQERSRSKS
jgi:hypothetical protein